MSLTGTLLSHLTLDATTGNVTIDSSLLAGNYTQEYQICEKILPSNCSTATMILGVDVTPLIAKDDTISVVQGYTGSINILSSSGGEDTLNGLQATTATVTPSLTGTLLTQ